LILVVGLVGEGLHRDPLCCLVRFVGRGFLEQVPQVDWGRLVGPDAGVVGVVMVVVAVVVVVVLVVVAVVVVVVLVVVFVVVVVVLAVVFVEVVVVAVDKHLSLGIVEAEQVEVEHLEPVFPEEPVCLKEPHPVSAKEPQTVFVAARLQIVFVAVQVYQPPRSGRRC